MPVIELETLIKADVHIVFDLARSIDLHKISAEQTSEEAIAGKTSGLIGMGESVTWRARHFGVYQTLSSKITEYKSPDYFVDEMLKGAFKRFKHEHRFAMDASGSTTMTDVFDYTSPYGMLGRIADVLFLKRYMRRLLEKRNQTIKEYSESERWKIVLVEHRLQSDV